MGILGWIVVVAGVAVGFLLLQMIYLGVVLRWADETSVGLAYYGLSPADRARYKRTLTRHAAFLAPILRLGRLSPVDLRKVRFQYRGISGPVGTCSAESFAKGAAYQPRPEDVFVVTQMKCGTTWMQHLVYQVLRRGDGDLVETGTTLYAVSPWLEGRKSVPIEQAPLHGRERPSRIIKTHFPVELCPWSGSAKYLYVARHPISCFASCVDFVAGSAGGMAPSVEAFEAWFCAQDAMWWGTWTEHVKGWWRKQQTEKNVLFVFFEDMKRDLAATAKQVASFLGVEPLTDLELARVVERCGFDYMQRHQESFEMHPPHILEPDPAMLVRGSADRHRDVSPEVRRRIAAWCVREMADSDFPLGRAYPDVVAGSVR